jgi:thiamine pyrophosphate-dependent acetolactate synthase large subunit-like protein
LLRDRRARVVNMLTGLYDAKLDQSPVVAISGQVPSAVLGRGPSRTST